MMMSSIDLANFAIVVSGFAISVLGLLLVVFLRRTNLESRSSFLIFFQLLVGYTASATLCQISSTALLSQIALFYESLFSSLLIPAITLYLFHCAGKSWRRSPLFALVIALWTVYFVLLVVTQFTRWIYYYTPDNVYHRGPWYPLLLIPPVLLMAADIIGLYRFRDVLTHRQCIAFLIYFVVPLVCMLIQMFSYGLLLIVFGTSLAVLFLFVFLLIDQIEQDLRRQQEIAHQRASIMVLQMRHHFIYNTLMTIYSLCNQDPQKARQVTLDFTNYLRKNFNAVASENPIPFTAELEHTRAYLAVEQAEHEELLLVEYDTPFTNFRLPPLTLQPIAENAVKHGMNPYVGPLRVLIRTRHTDAGTEITVEDNGSGFDSSDKIKPHTTLENIRQRLEMMCGGTMKIEQQETGGTRVTIFVPVRKSGSQTSVADSFS